MDKHLLILVTALVLINAELNIFEDVLMPKAFLRWNIPNVFQKAPTVFEKKEIIGKKSNIVPVSMPELKYLNAIKHILNQMLANKDQERKVMDRNNEMNQRKRKQEAKLSFPIPLVLSAFRSLSPFHQYKIKISSLNS
jgi:hypothetical protein